MAENENITPNPTPEGQPTPEATTPKKKPVARKAPVAKKTPAVKPPAVVEPVSTPVVETTPTVVETPTVQKTAVVKPAVVQSSVKKGRKLSPRLVVIGCIGFITIFILGLFGALYVGLQNPSRLANIGIEPANAKSLLMIIAGVFFGVIFLFGFGFLAINTYRLVRNKGGSKAKYFAGMFIGFMLLGISIGLGAVAISKVQGIKVDSYANTDELVIPYLITSSANSAKPEYTYAKGVGIHMIAPLDIAYQINEDIVNLKYSNVAGNNPPLAMVLDCGNGNRTTPSQLVNGNGYIDGDNAFFDSTCLYINKGTYRPKITFTYRDPVKQQNQSFTLDAGSITISAQLNVTVDGRPIGTNSGNSELIVGDAPLRVQIDAKNIFSELGITDNNIIWDMETDGTEDKENKVTFGYNYLDPQLYTVSYRFPNSADNLSNLRYHFYLRVNQSDTPRCAVNSVNEGNFYTFNTMWSGGTDVTQDINSYKWEIYDIDNERTVQTLPARKDSLEYTFTEQGNYTARLIFSTVDSAQGLCESDVVHAGAPAYDIKYSIMYKKPGQANFSPFPDTGAIAKIGDNIIIDSLPVDIRVQVNDITPKPASATLNIKLGDDVMYKKSATIFERTISESEDQNITIIVEDEQGTKSEKMVTVTLNQSIIQGRMTVKPDKGTEPLTVTLDASTTKLNDPTDEIVYFMWDFGDGETTKNISQGNVTHIYKYNTQGTDVQYRPSVTVTTRKGYKATFSSTIPVSVQPKPSSVEITLPENPTQVGQVGKVIKMAMQSDGQIRQITWDYGDGNTFNCSFRSCSETNHTYVNPGRYNITVRVNYDDREEATSSMAIEIK